MAKTQTISQLYDTYPQAAAAVRDLEAKGISSSKISMIANQSDVLGESATSGTESGLAGGAALGGLAGGGAGLLAGLGLLAIPGIGPVVAAGWLAATAIGAAAGATAGGMAGGLIGALTNSGVDPDDAHVFAEGVRRGGTLVTVRCEPSDEDAVAAILRAHNPVDAAARGDEYRGEGWDGFNAQSEPYRRDSDLPPL